MTLSFPRDISAAVKESIAPAVKEIPAAVRNQAAAVRDQARAVARDALKTFDVNETLADTGDALLDEQDAIVLRRKIVARNGANDRTDAATAIGKRVKGKRSRPLPNGECSFAEQLAPVVADPETKARQEASEAKLDKYYARAHKMGDLSALCLSGGGIRSAAFALGVAQGLAKRDLLHKFDYLSTVSGGGYFGSFLTAWVQRRGYADVCDELAGKLIARSPLQYLRGYTSYLTPDRGPFTADMLSVVAIYMRNLFLNWLVIVPLIAIALLTLKAYAVWIWSLPAEPAVLAPLVLAAICTAGIVTMESLRQRPGWETSPRTLVQFRRYVQWMLFVCGLAASIVALKYLQQADQLSAGQTPVSLPTYDEVRRLRTPKGPTLLGSLLFPALAIGAINFISWMIAFYVSPEPNKTEMSTRSNVRTNNLVAFANLASFTFCGLIAGAYLGLLFYGVAQFRHFEMIAFILLCLGPPAVVSAIFLAETIHVGLTSTTRWSDAEREWLATAAGHHGRMAVIWMLLTLVTFGGAYVIFYVNHGDGPSWFTRLFTLGTTGGFAALIVAWLGKASATAATLRERYDTWKNWSANIILSIATPVFLVITFSLLSSGIDYLVAGDALSFPVAAQYTDTERSMQHFPIRATSVNWWLLLLLALLWVGCALLCFFASLAINTNRFSLHGLYRNRLIRAFLGGSRQASRRRPNPLSRFDEKDNLNLSQLWPNRYGPPPDDVDPSETRQFPAGALPPQFLVINCALNVLRTTNLAWQERKALSLTCTPRGVGAAALDQGAGCYRRTCDYGSTYEGISLGTAMTISGAAVSPNMGYHSSPALSVLMTFFNVRLGAWLGNPGPSGARVVSQEGPRVSALPLIQEALGLATEDKAYVYLSDGGHFENLGLYEMVRRRCHFVVLSDAGCDPDITFEDLGNAVRKISIDLNVTIEFETLHIPPRKTPPVTGGYVATAKIIYPEAGAKPGHLLYIKPSYRGTEPASVRAYAEANTTFPHEPTSDQMFGESQFEAYRALGEYIVQTVDGQPGWKYQSIEAFIEAVNRHLKNVSAAAAAKAK